MVFGSLGYGPVAEGRPVRMRRLPCCGLGLGWCLWVSLPLHMCYFPVFPKVTTELLTKSISLPWTRFITGFFLAAIPWFIGAFVLICVRVHDQREKPGYVACTIAVSSFLLIQCNSAAHFFTFGIWHWAAWNCGSKLFDNSFCCSNWNEKKILLSITSIYYWFWIVICWKFPLNYTGLLNC